ncbi:MAG: hypothetical protein IBX70_13470 [Clostridia bacterium]|nr:hypothetical protein [Clostridia bacterium]
MTDEALVGILETTEFDIAYSDFKEKPEPPFIAYILIESVNFVADNEIYAKIGKYRVELYTETKDEIAQGKIESAFSENEIIYNKDESYLDGENLFVTMYDIELLIS